MLTDLVYIPFTALQKFSTSGNKREDFELGYFFSLFPSAGYNMTFSCFLFGLNEGLALFPSCTTVPSTQRTERQEELSLLTSPGNEQYFSLLLTPERTRPRGFKAPCCEWFIKKKTKQKNKPQSKAQSKPFNWHKRLQYIKLRFFTALYTVLLVFLTCCALFLDSKS